MTAPDRSRVVDGYELRAPQRESEWAAYHAIRRNVLFERRGQLGVYDPAHPDESKPGHHPLVLLFQGEPVGVIRVDLEPDAAIFRRVAIREDVQRKGHGRNMLDLAERFVRSQRRQLVRSHVAAEAVGFYERCGFLREAGAGAGNGSVLMSKTLDSLD